jgi:DNA-binding IclR family transcriptional regulator
LAKATGTDKDALGRLLTALSTVGICAPAGQDRYSLTEIGAGLDGGAEHSFKNWAIFEGEMLSKSWNGMLESITTGKSRGNPECR